MVEVSVIEEEEQQREDGGGKHMVAETVEHGGEEVVRNTPELFADHDKVNNHQHHAQCNTHIVQAGET